MRRFPFALILASALPLAACTTYNPLGDVLGSVLGGNNYYGQGGQSFEAAAAEACGSQAQRYGQASVTDVRAQSSSTLRVSGYVNASDGYRHSFGCSFRSDGQITDFDIN
jgi:hypothetical protein